MRTATRFAIFALFTAVLLAAQTSPPQNQRPGRTTTPDAAVNPAPQSALIRILTPVAGQASTASSVQVTFELTNPGADAGEPNFKIQLDGRDPISTTSTEYTFTGLGPGSHSVTVTLVDANGTPITGGQAVVQFQVRSATPATGSASIRSPFADVVAAAGLGTGSLAILGLIGFGVLIGGTISSIKLRH